MCYLRGEDPEFRQRVDDMVNFNMLDVAEWQYMPVYTILESFLPVIQTGHAPVIKPEHFGIYDVLADCSKLTIRE